MEPEDPIRTRKSRRKGARAWRHALLTLVLLLAGNMASFGQETINTPSPRGSASRETIVGEPIYVDPNEGVGPYWTPTDDPQIEWVPEEGEAVWNGQQNDYFVPRTGYVGGYQEPWDWTLLPNGLIYRSYLAGPKESRFRSVWAYDDRLGWIWDITLGGRVGIVRYGTTHSDDIRPQGWQLDAEGAAFPRLDPEEDRDLVSADFRFGVPLTYSVGRYETKLAYYHLSSHIGDEYLLKNPTFVRINYVRDAIVWGNAYYLTDDVRLYGEVGYAFYTSGGADPIELQMGAEYSPAHFTGFRGAPFLAVNGYLREEFDFGGNLTAQAGWQWRGQHNRRLLRIGGEYSNGKTEQFEFYANTEERFGFGLWYDY